MSEDKQIIVKVSKDLHENVKTECARLGLTISGLVRRLLREWLEKHDCP